MEINYPIVKITDDYAAALREYGVVVIEDIIPAETCDDYCESILDSFIAINPNIDRNDLKNTWLPHHLPQQTRTGLFQTLMGNLECVWNLRGNEQIIEIFRTIYSDLRGSKVQDLIVSGDGINYHPAHVKATSRAKDWAHLDQTDGDTYKCVQGQVVLSDTESSFVCTPKSHLKFDEILDNLNIRSKKNWHKFTDTETTTLREDLENYQIPIVAKKGSLILWLSSTIHSARIQSTALAPRCIVYVSYRPKTELDKRTINRRIKAYVENRVTNHWISKLFPKVSLHVPKYDERMLDIVKNPTRVYEILGKPELDEVQKRLIGL